MKLSMSAKLRSLNATDRARRQSPDSCAIRELHSEHKDGGALWRTRLSPGVASSYPERISEFRYQMIYTAMQHTV
jgi:hypothetical protein